MSDAGAQRTIEAVWRIESARLVAGLARLVRGDLALAEELAQEAFVAALTQWPGEGVPENPGAWLMTTARRRAIDLARRDRVFRRAHADVARSLVDSQESRNGLTPIDEALDGGVDDDVLRLMFMTCHPCLAPEARAAITLRLVCGLTTGEIARAYLAPEPTIAQRIVRAKRALAENRVSFEPARGEELPERLASVLEGVYLLFNEGYTATVGDEWMRPELCDEALRLGRILAALLPDQAEAHGLVALMELHASRTRARTDASGAPVLLLDQNRAHWDRLLIRRGLASLETALRLAPERGPYALQAAIAACHARARDGASTDWDAIARLYAELGALTPSPIIELNRAVAVGMARGAGEALAIIDRLADEPALAGYHLLPAVRGDLLSKLGRLAEAKLAFEEAAALTRNGRERVLLLERAARLE